MPKFGLFGPRSINFLIIKKVHMCPISKVLISNLTILFSNFLAQMPNFGLIGPKGINFLISRKPNILKVLISNVTFVL